MKVPIGLMYMLAAIPPIRAQSQVPIRDHVDSPTLLGNVDSPTLLDKVDPPTPLDKVDSATQLDGIGSVTSCASCYSALLSLKGTALFGDDFFVRRVTNVCKLARFEDDDVCEGAVASEGPIIAHDLREMAIPSHTAQLFCTTVFGVCDIPEVRPYNLSFPKPKPEGKRTPLPLSRSGEEPLKFVHFSDIHVDHSYEVGSNYNCTKPICCRSYGSEDAPGNTSYPARQFGEHLCDSPKALEVNMYEAMNQIAPDASFALFTGDIPEHAVWEVDRKSVTFAIYDAYETMSSILPMPVFGTLGNHESAPVNSFPPRGIQHAISSQWVFDAVSKAWERWTGRDARTAHHYGAYAHKVHGLNLKVISLNSQFYYRSNPWMYEREMQYDPNGQLAWLVKELQLSEDAEERVYIMAHVPPGVGDALYDQSNYLAQIINRYEATIAAMFFGHTHRDHFQISYNNYTQRSHSTANMVAYISPSLTPTSGSPAFKVFTVDPVTFGVLDFETYAASLETPDWHTHGPAWEMLYSAREAYGPLINASDLEELTPAFWHNVTVAFEQDGEEFQNYFLRKSRGWNLRTCEDECKEAEICELRAAESQYNCLKPRSALSISEVETLAEEDECQDAGILRFLKGFAREQTMLAS